METCRRGTSYRNLGNESRAPGSWVDVHFSMNGERLRYSQVDFWKTRADGGPDFTR